MFLSNTQDIWLVVAICIILIGVLVVWRIFGSSMEQETTDELQESIAKSREKFLNDIVSFIFYRYNISADSVEDNTVTTSQIDYDSVIVAVNLDDLCFHIVARFNDGYFTILAQQIMPSHDVVLEVEKIDFGKDLVCNYYKMQKFFNRFNNKILSWTNNTYQDLLIDMAEIAASCSSLCVDDNMKDRMLFESAVEFSTLIENKKFRDSNFIQAYIKLLTFIYASDKNIALADFIKDQMEKFNYKN